MSTNDDNSNEDFDQTHQSNNDLIIDQGFAVLNNFRLPKGGKDKNTPNENSNPEIPRCSFASFPSSTLTVNPDQLSNIIHDCHLAFTAQPREDGDAYSSGSTYFMPITMKPRCALEDLALTIFHAHTKDIKPGIHYDPERSGAEWWTLVLETDEEKENKEKDSTSDNDDDDDEDDDDEIGIHFDADYGLEEQLPNYLLHPRIATVTYFSNHGVPTIVFDKKSPPPADVEKKTLNGPIHKVWLSYPEFGKHIAFDGRLLHGGLASFLPTQTSGMSHGMTSDNDKGNEKEPNTKRQKLEDSSNSDSIMNHKRVTFMVNIWLNHCPIDADLLDDEICSEMITKWESDDPSDDDINKNGANKVSRKRDHEYSPPFSWTLDDVSQADELEEFTLNALSSSSSGDINEEDKLEDQIHVICNREITFSFSSSISGMEDLADKVFKVKGKSSAVILGENVLNLKVGDVVENDEDSD